MLTLHKFVFIDTSVKHFGIYVVLVLLSLSMWTENSHQGRQSSTCDMLLLTFCVRCLWASRGAKRLKPRDRGGRYWHVFQGLARPNQSSQKQSYDLQESTLMTERFAPVTLVHEFLEVTGMRFICARQGVLVCFAGDCARISQRLISFSEVISRLIALWTTTHCC